MIPLASPNKMPISIRRRRNRCQIGQLLRSEKIALRFDGSLVIIARISLLYDQK